MFIRVTNIYVFRKEDYPQKRLENLLNLGKLLEPPRIIIFLLLQKNDYIKFEAYIKIDGVTQENILTLIETFC